MDPLRALDLNLLLALHHLLETQSVQAAAARMQVGQPAMSASLARLRVVFDDPLLVRVGRQMQPTERAQELVAPLRDLVEGTRRLLVPLTPFDPATDPWDARVAMSDETRAWLAPLLLARIRGEAPQVNLRLRALTQDSTRAGRTGEIDLAVFPEPTGLPAGSAPDLGPFVVKRLYSVSYVLAHAPRHPHGPGAWTLEDYAAADHALVVSWEGMDRGFADEVLTRRGLSRRLVVTVPSFVELVALLHSDGNLVSLMPDVLARGSGLLFGPVPFGEWPAHFCYAFHPRTAKDPRIRWLRALLEDTVRQAFPGGGSGARDARAGLPLQPAPDRT